MAADALKEFKMDNVVFFNEESKEIFEKSHGLKKSVEWLYDDIEDVVIIEVYDKEVMYTNSGLKRDLEKNGFKKRGRDYVAANTREHKVFADRFCRYVNDEL